MAGEAQPTDPVETYHLLIADVYELAGLSRNTSEQIAHEAGGPTVAQWHVMSVVSEDASAVPDIARRLGLARQSVQRVVNDLIESDHVRLLPNPAHRRSPLVGLTEQGRRALETAISSSAAIRAQQLARARIPPAEMSAARAAIRRLIDALSQGTDPPSPGP